MKSGDIMPMRKQEISQWSGQFFVAAELTRRGYRVSFTLGTVPSTDLVAISPKGKLIKVEVKTVRKEGSSWIVRKVPKDDDLYYVLAVSRPKDNFPAPKFWILTSHEIKAILRKRKRDGTDLQVYRSDLTDEPGWEKLPHYNPKGH